MRLRVLFALGGLGSFALASCATSEVSNPRERDTTELGIVQQALSTGRTWSEWVPRLRVNDALVNWDSTRGRAFVMGGESFASDTVSGYRLEAASVMHDFSTEPSFPVRLCSTYDPINKEHLVLFSKSSGTSTTPVPWSYDAATRTWAQKYLPSALGNIIRCRMVADPQTGTIFMLGKGFYDSSARLFTLKKGVWQERSPSPYTNDDAVWSALTWDSKRGRPIAVGSQRFPDQVAAYTFDDAANTWTAAASNVVPFRRGFNATYDAANDQVVLVNPPLSGVSDVWTLNLATKVWTKETDSLPPSPPSLSFPLYFDAAAGAVAILTDRGGAFGEVWRRNAATKTWARAAEYETVVPDADPWAMAYDTALGRGLKFTSARETWAYTSSGWKRLTTTNPPPARGGYAFAFDSRRNLAVLWGGFAGGLRQNDTWEFDGANGAWTKRTLVHAPAPGGEVGMVYDDVNQFFVLVNEDGQTWTYDGTDWKQSTTANPPARVGYGMTYDKDRKRTVLWGGRSFTDYRNDTWEFDGTNWAQKQTTRAPAPSTARQLAYDPAAQRTLLFGELAWEYDGKDWSLIPNAPPGCGGGGPSYYDPLQHAVVSVGSTPVGGDPLCARTWLTSSFGARCTGDADCGENLFCTDGICCASKTCATCQTCAGRDPGTCTDIVNDEDPDSCAAKDKKRCNRESACVPDLSAQCTNNEGCASGYCADGICCDAPCDGACRSCKGAEKIDGVDGRCGPAKVGSNPRGACEPSATCNAAGACETRVSVTKATICRDERTLLNADDSTQDCSPYRCEGSACKVGCNSYKDCVFPATCDPSGICTTERRVLESDGCSCASGPRPRRVESTEWGFVALGVAALLCARARRRARSTSTR